MNDQSWTGEHLIRSRRIRHAGSGLNMKTRTKANESAERIARREKVGALLGKGLTGVQIAKELGCGRSTVCSDLRALGLR